MSSAANEWCTIESDPGVFTELLERIGVVGVQVDELWSLDAHQLRAVAPVYGLVFLFKWDASIRPTPATADSALAAEQVYFAKQVISNACATQAITAILLNLAAPDVDIGPLLREFKANTADFPPEMRGLALSNVDAIRDAHNSFARPEPFVHEGERPAAKKGDDVFHFVSFLPVNGRLWELDGLAQAPVDHGACEADQFCDLIVPVLERRIARYAEGEIKFALMALTHDRRAVLRQRIAATTDAALAASLAAELASEDEKRRQWALENVRRRHNYIPFIVRFLDILAKSGKLDNILAAANERHDQKAAAAAESKRARKSEN